MPLSILYTGNTREGESQLKVQAKKKKIGLNELQNALDPNNTKISNIAKRCGRCERVHVNPVPPVLKKLEKGRMKKIKVKRNKGNSKQEPRAEKMVRRARRQHN